VKHLIRHFAVLLFLWQQILFCVFLRSEVLAHDRASHTRRSDRDSKLETVGKVPTVFWVSAVVNELERQCTWVLTNYPILLKSCGHAFVPTDMQAEHSRLAQLRLWRSNLLAPLSVVVRR
jgi:hypothetical protein